MTTTTDVTLDRDWALRWAEAAQQAVAEHRSELMELDRAIGDGDHGDNLDRGFTAVTAKLAEAAPPDLAGVLKTMATTLMSAVGGAAGPLYGTAFLRAATTAGGAGLDGLDGAATAALLDAAATGIEQRGKATTGEKTMVDAWRPAATAAQQTADEGGAAREVLEAAAAAAEAGAEATEPLVATKGRASYLGERSAGHRDPGAQSSALLLRCAVRAVDAGRP